MLEFQTAILALEDDGCTVLEIDGIMRKLLNQLKSRLQDKFYGSKNRSILTKLPNAEKEIFNKEAEQFSKGPSGIWKNVLILVRSLYTKCSLSFH